MPTSRRCSPPAPDDCGDGSRDLPRAPRPTAPTWPSRSRRRVVPLSEKLLQRRRAADLRDAEPGPGRRGEPQQRQHGRDLLVEGVQPEDRPVPAHRHAGPGRGSGAARAPSTGQTATRCTRPGSPESSRGRWSGPTCRGSGCTTSATAGRPWRCRPACTRRWSKNASATPRSRSPWTSTATFTEGLHENAANLVGGLIAGEAR